MNAMSVHGNRNDVVGLHARLIVGGAGSRDPFRDTVMSTPQTPDSMQKSQQDKKPPEKPQGDAPGKLSDDSGDRADERQGGH